MPDVATIDPDVVIEASGKQGGVPWLRYRRVSTGARWTVRATCNRCGLCVLGVAVPINYTWQGPPGTPNAVTDVRVQGGRPDEPIVPGFLADMRQMARQTATATVAGCSLTIDEEPPA